MPISDLSGAVFGNITHSHFTLKLKSSGRQAVPRPRSPNVAVTEIQNNAKTLTTGQYYYIIFNAPSGVS